MAGAGGLSALVAVTIVERDQNKDVIVSWTYPGLQPTEEKTVVSRTRLAQPPFPPFTFSRLGDNWLYVLTTVLHEEKETNTNTTEIDVDAEEAPPSPRLGPIPRVNAFSVCVASKEYNPEMYAVLSRQFASVYRLTGSPIPLLKSYLSVLTRGTVQTTLQGPEGPNGEEGEQLAVSFSASEHDKRVALLATPLKDVIRTFGIESILIWTALMMKKRVVLFCDRLPVLLKIIRAFPLFVFHRKDWNMLRPLVNLEQTEEVEELKKTGVYVAGFDDPQVRSRSDLFDLFVDCNTRSVTVPEHAKVDFRLGGFHKELGTWLLSASEGESTNEEIIRELSARTREFLKKLLVLQVEDEDGNRYITEEGLAARNLPANMDHFVLGVAAAEGLTKGTSRS